MLKTLTFKPEPQNGRVLVLDGDQPLGFVSERNLKEYLWSMNANDSLEEQIALKMRDGKTSYAVALREAIAEKKPGFWERHSHRVIGGRDN